MNINRIFLSRENNYILTNGETLVFDNIIDSEGITYNFSTGEITITETGLYHINWWVTTQSVLTPNNVVFELVVTAGENIISNSPSRTGQLSGFGTINIETVPTILYLKNSSGGNATLSQSAIVKAMLEIIRLTEKTPKPNSMITFQYRQLAHVIGQLIVKYPSNVFRIYLPGLYYAVGTMQSLYTSPQGTDAGLLVMDDNSVIGLNAILALKAEDGTIYDDTITYLSLPSPMPSDIYGDVITAFYDHLNIGDSIDITWGIGQSTTGVVYKKAYGMIVVTTDMTGADPFFVLPTSSVVISPTTV